MRKQLGRELRLLAVKKSMVVLWAVLAAAGGVLLWVNGSMAPWVFRTCQMPKGTPCFTVFFLLWLTLYTIHGAEWGLSMLFQERDSRRNLVTWLMRWFAYVLLLAWYPLFFSLLHGFLAVLVLLGSAFLHTVALLRNRYCSILLWGAYFFTSLLEIYFLYVTIAFSWVK